MTALRPFKQLIHQYSGLLLQGSVAEQRLSQALQEAQQRLGLDATQYQALLQQSRAELDALVSQLTINETYFFREPEQIQLFTQTLWPRLLQQAGPRPIRILSAGCSSGEEPYSLVIALVEYYGRGILSRLHMDAVDVDLEILEKAKQAVYPPFSFRSVDSSFMRKYFTLGEQGYQLKESIRHCVNFAPMNLKAERYLLPGSPYDAIFFRNVSIYFDPATRKAIQQRFACIMQPDALLFLGSSETLGNDFNIFQLCEEQGQYYFVQGQALRPPTPVPTPAQTEPTAERTPPRPPPPPTAIPACSQRTPPSVLPSLQHLKQLLQEERYTEAASKLELLLRAHPDSQPARLMKAWVALNTRHFSQASQLLQQLLEEDAWHLEALLSKGLALKWQARTSEACDVFKTACYAHPESWLAHYLYGDCLRDSGQTTGTSAPLQAARRILSHNLQADSGCQWLPLALPARDVLFLIERQLLGLKRPQPPGAITKE